MVRNPEVRAEGGVTVAAQGNVEVSLQPARQRDVPAFPEVAAVGRLVWRVEVARQVEAHEQREADGDVRVAREVGIHLQRIGEEGHKVLEAGEEHRVFEHAVDEVHRDVVAQDDFLEQSVENPEHGHAELQPAQAVFPVELGNEVAGLHDGPCHELGEEGDVESEVEEVAHGFHFPLYTSAV